MYQVDHDANPTSRRFSAVRHTGPVVLGDALIVIGGLGLLIYVGIRALSGTGRKALTIGPGQWRTTHYDVKGITRVVVQKVSPGGANILSEHVVTTIRVDDPDYDAKFLAAMSAARERRAMFESEDDS
jgi:hypothetical protein